MNNFLISAKRFITNKNTITILGVVGILIILYYGYSSTITSAVNPVKVPVAKEKIGSQTKITSDDIKWIEVPSISKPGNVILNENQIVGKYTGVNATIPKESMFYSEMLVNEDELPGKWLEKLKTDETGATDKPVQFSVNIETTYGNSIQPDDYIDIYMKAENENKEIMFGKLIENVQVLDVMDSNGKSVFADVTANLIPAYLCFGVSAELYNLLITAEFLSREGVMLLIVPHGGTVPLGGDIDVQVSSQYLRDFILAHSEHVPSDDEYIGQIENNGEE